jgi:hypothetical protein
MLLIALYGKGGGSMLLIALREAAPCYSSL